MSDETISVLHAKNPRPPYSSILFADMDDVKGLTVGEPEVIGQWFFSDRNDAEQFVREMRKRYDD